MTAPALPEDRVVLPGDRRYPMLRSTYTTVAAPAVIALPRDANEVAAALADARERGHAIAVRSGGHGLSGRSSNDGGTVIDLSALRAVDVDVAVDTDRRIVRVEAGARWATVAEALAPRGWAISSGDHGNVGVGGLATAGGIGWLARSYGLTLDHVLAVEVVLADGTMVRADRDHEPDLFWAMRGAGGSVGIATAFEIEAAPVRDVGFAQVVVEADQDTLRRWSEHMAAAPRALTTTATTQDAQRRTTQPACPAGHPHRRARPRGRGRLRTAEHRGHRSTGRRGQADDLPLVAVERGRCCSTRC
jgi:FAD/FMN-containing dehydrogenase